MRFSHRLLCLFVLLSLILAACGTTAEPPASTSAPGTQPTSAPQTSAPQVEGTQPTATPEPPPTNGQTSNYETASQKLIMWIMPNGPQPLRDALVEAEAFSKANPDIGVEVQLVDWGNAYPQIQTALQGGAGACVTQMGTTWVSGFHPLEGLRPYTQAEIDAMGGASAYVKASWDTTGTAGTNEVVAMPWFVDVRALAYRKDILQQVGLTPEEAFKDMAAFEQTLQKVKAANIAGMDPFAHTGRGDWNVIQNASMFMWNYGADILSPDNKSAVFNSPESVEAVTFFSSLFGKGLTPKDAPEINTVQAEARMGDGTVFSVVTGPWMISTAAAPADAGGWTNEAARSNLAFAEFPAGPGGKHTFIGGSNLGIFKECPHPEAAVELVKFLLTPESQVRFGKAIGFLPALLKAQEDPAFDNPMHNVFKAAASTGKVPPAIVEWGGVENIMKTELEKIWEEVAANPGQVIDPNVVKSHLDAGVASTNDILSQ